MARMTRIVILIVMLNILVGCNESNTGKGQVIAPIAKPALTAGTELLVADSSEVDLVEKMTTHRQAYRQGLEALMQYYSNIGNNMKLQWAEKELAELDAMPQYKYVIEAAVAGANLRATDSIPEADTLYQEAVDLHKEAEKLVVVKDKDYLYLALDRYDQVFRKYPSSDKIDDAAYKAGTIYEHFKDYTIAAMYYERAYQWDTATVHPARFRRAYILDNRLHQRAEALQLYQDALTAEGTGDRYQSWKEYAAKRVGELTKTLGPTLNQ